MKDFAAHLEALYPDILSVKNIAVAVSGGADSMMLAHLMKSYARGKGLTLYVFIVDHGLRRGSQNEAQFVAKTLKDGGFDRVKILSKRGNKPTTRIQEWARNLRYDLLTTACKKQKINLLMTAHHGDDQMETFLMRLKRGSGLRGLIGMEPVSHTNGITLLRPLLHLTHEDALTYCRRKKIPWVEDPSNQNMDYERVRIRNILPALKAEGVSVEMLNLALTRLTHARDTIDYYIEKEHKNYLVISEPSRSVYDSEIIRTAPFEILVQILLRAVATLSQKDYAPSLAAVETIATKLREDAAFRAASLGKATIRYSRSRKTLEITAAKIK